MAWKLSYSGPVRRGSMSSMKTHQFGEEGTGTRFQGNLIKIGYFDQILLQN